MNILGISAFYHDSAAAALRDGRVLAAAHEERFTRKKHDPAFPAQAVRFCLRDAGLSLGELDAVVFYDKPFLKLERLLETYYANAPRGLRSFLAALPVWIKEKMFLKKLIRDELLEIEPVDFRKVKLLFPEHHLSHAASAYYPSPFDEAAILTIDGVGEWATASICRGEGNRLQILKELRFPHSVGLLYSAFTYYLGFKVNSGEYKLMGLAPYGDHESEAVKRFEKLITENLVAVNDDGSIFLDQGFFDYATGLKMAVDWKWEKLFGFGPRDPESELEQPHCDLALAIQNVTEEILLKMAREAKNLTGSRNLCLAGGVALNCVANGKLQRAGIFDGLYIQPAAGDAGGALGAALAAHHIYFDRPKARPALLDDMAGAFLGPEFSDLEVERMARRFGAPCRKFEDFGALARRAAEILAESSVVGWFQGRAEWGPRALGNRSILADARDSRMQSKLNLKIKFREGFRPFAPAVLAEDARKYFDLAAPSPYMLLVAEVLPSRRLPLPEGFLSLPLRQRVHVPRSDIPAVTHVDYSARVQTVHKETNPRFHGLLSAFKERTGCSVIVNTSFNVRGEPIVLTPEEAYRCLMRTEMDWLVVNNFLFDKKEQPPWVEKGDWRTQYGLD